MNAGADHPAPRLYVGAVMHQRLRPRRHGLRYRVYCLWLDVDRLEETAARLRLFSIDRWNLFSFRRRDHGARDGRALRPWVEQRLAEAGMPRPAAIMLLSFPRVLGYAFNPLSVYYCYDRDGALCALIYEVKNTFGDQHAYAVPAGATVDGAYEQERDKEFFVSPFIDMDKRYLFRLRAPDERLALRIKQRDAEGDYLIASWNGAAESLSDGRLLRRFFSHPLMTIKVIVGIHWEALRLFLKGVRFLGHPGEAKVVVGRRGAQVRVREGVVPGE